MGIVSGVLAQRDPEMDSLPRWQLSLNVGPSVPVGKFGSRDINDAQAAFAKVGTVLDVTTAYRVGTHWGISLALDGESHRVDDNVVGNRMDALRATTHFYYGSTPWRIGRALAGIFGEWPIGTDGHWEWTAGASAGVLVTALPSVSILEGSASSDGPTPLPSGGYEGTYFTDNNTIRFTLAYAGHLGFRYRLSPGVFVDLQAEYTGAKLNTPYTKASLASQVNAGADPNGGGTSTSEGSSTPQPLSTVNATLGLGLMF